MLCKALSSLVLALAFVAPSYAQDVFVPRELKAQPVHPVAAKEPVKPKETVRRAEAVTEADAKPAANPEVAKARTPKTDSPAVKAEKVAVMKPSAPPVKAEKAPATTVPETATRKIAKAEATKPEPAKEKAEKAAAPEKKAVAKSQANDDSVATIKVEKAPAPAKETAVKTVAKADTAKTDTAASRKDKATAPKDKPDVDVPMIKVEKATVSKETSTSKPIAKADAAKPEAAREKADKPAAPPKDKAAVEIVKKAPAKSDNAVAKADKSVETHKTAKTDSVQIETFTTRIEKTAAKETPATVAVSKPKTDEKLAAAKEEASKSAAKPESPKVAPVIAKTEKSAPSKEKLAAPKVEPPKTESLLAKAEPPSPREGPTKMLPVKADIVSVPSQRDAPDILPAVTGSSLDTGFTRIADGFDFPVGKPEAEGYYKARGFRPNGHLGEDWDGVRGGDTDLRDPIYSIGDGIVVFARDVHLGWGNVIIVRHAFREGGNVKYIDALYGHLNTMLVGRGQRVTRGQQIATMGTAHGRYDAHLHFEIRKNLEIGMSRAKFSKDFSNYYDPTQFIASHRHLSGGGSNYKVAMNTFTHDWMYHFDSNHNFPARKRGSTAESSAALHRALTSRN